MTEKCPAVMGRKGVEGRRQSAMERVQVPSRRLSQMGLELGKSHLNRVQIGAVRRQITEANSTSGKQPADVLDFVRGEVVEDKRVARAQLRTEHLLKIDREDLGIHRPFHQKRGGDAFLAQSRDEGGTLPVAMWDGTVATLTNRATPIKAAQLGVQTRFIDKHQPADIPIGLLQAPKLPGGSDLRPILLGGASRFFYSSDPVAPAGATRR
jgi:hypothetical protein